jgi:hypothetical protein
MEALQSEPMPMWAKASVHIDARFPTARHPDPDNFIASLKSAFDGVADAGIVADDRGLWPDRPVFSTDRKCPCVVLTVTEEGNAESSHPESKP